MQIIINLLKILFYFLIGIISIILLSQIIIYIYSLLFGQKIIKLEKDNSFNSTKIVSIFKESNITVYDKDNYIKKLYIDNPSAVSIKTNKNNIREIFINHVPIKLSTDKHTMKILNATHKHIGDSRGIDIYEIELNQFYVDKNRQFTYKTFVKKL